MTKTPLQRFEIRNQGAEAILEIKAVITSEEQVHAFQAKLAEKATAFFIERQRPGFTADLRRKKIVEYFLSDKTRHTHVLQYEYRKSYSQYAEDRAILFKMISEGCVKLINKDSKTKTFQYFPDKDLTTSPTQINK